MYKSGFVIGPVSIDGGVQTTNTLLDELDLAGCSQIRGTLSVTKALTEGDDLLDVYIQSLAEDGITWNDRAHFGQITGGDSPTVTAPEVRFVNITARIAIEATEEAYESSGSLGGTRLPAGTVRNGPFPDKLYSGGLWVANWRIQVVVVDPTGANADFEGKVWLSFS